MYKIECNKHFPCFSRQSESEAKRALSSSDQYSLQWFSVLRASKEYFLCFSMDPGIVLVYTEDMGRRTRTQKCSNKLPRSKEWCHSSCVTKARWVREQHIEAISTANFCPKIFLSLFNKSDLSFEWVLVLPTGFKISLEGSLVRKKSSICLEGSMTFKI